MKILITTIFAWILALPAFAAQTDCPDHYADGQAPELVNARMRERAKELCFEAFGVVHSGITRTPLWSAEYLTKQRIEAAAQLPRLNRFHAEKKLPTRDRATLKDYKGSGYDRGHMSPNHDMPTTSAQFESFSLANIVPQAAKINQNLWEGVESAIRTTVTNDGRNLYVITGPLFEGEEIGQLNDRVFIPTSVFKAVYDPQRQQAAAYVATNAKNASGLAYDAVSIWDLEHRLGINLFPQLSDAIKKQRMDLPEPTPHGHGHR